MTVIAGLVVDDTVYIAGDSAGVAGHELHVRADEKVFAIPDFIMGFTSSFRMGQLLRYRMRPPLHEPDADLMRYMVVEFIDTVRKCLADGGYRHMENEVESGGTFLVGHGGQLFKVGSDFQVGVDVNGYVAVGSGSMIAEGAIHALLSLPPRRRPKPADIIRTALEAAEAHNVTVRRPFHVVMLKKGAK